MIDCNGWDDVVASGEGRFRSQIIGTYRQWLAKPAPTDPKLATYILFPD
jgi:hypothetical protein